jgi:hypothetical protein
MANETAGGIERSGIISITAERKPLGGHVIEMELPEGQSISAYLKAAGLNPKLAPWFHVAVDGQEVSPVWWDRVRPKAGRQLVVSIVPTGDNGGDKNKTLRTVLTIAVLVVAAVVAWYTPPPTSAPCSLPAASRPSILRC